MQYRLLGFFSGFPSHHFPQAVAERLGAALERRESLVFISAWPDEHDRNDCDLAGMYAMFEEIGLPFAQRHVIDSRMEPSRAAALLRDASCIFLMGGHPGLQRGLIEEMGLDAAIRGSDAVVLGVSAGAINMAKHSLDTKESLTPYKGLDLADITVKPHFLPGDQTVLADLLSVSMTLPVYAMEDDSAIFVEGGVMTHTGKIYRVHKGEICPLAPGKFVSALHK